MSWFASFTDTYGETRDDYNPDVISGGDNAPEATKDAFYAAVEAAISVVRSGVLGFGKKLNISFQGHANVGHVPSSGWVNDCVTIQLSQVSE